MSATARLFAPALLAGLSSGLLARFQLFAICGSASGASGATFSLYAGVLPGIVALAGLAIERLDRRHALLALFALRAVLLGALALDLFANGAAIAAAAFAVLDYLTLPTLMRDMNTTANPACVSQQACPGIAHHAGMFAGAALATTSWGFGQGFAVLFLLGGALNLVCACTLATPRRAATDSRYPVPSTHLPSSTPELQQ